MKVPEARRQALVKWLAQHGIPEPEFERKFHPARKWRFDLCWLAGKIALEIEGGIYGGKTETGRRYKGAHSSISGIKRDLEKYNEAVLHGWKLLRVPADRLYTLSTVDLIRRAFSL